MQYWMTKLRIHCPKVKTTLLLHCSCKHPFFVNPFLFLPCVLIFKFEGQSRGGALYDVRVSMSASWSGKTLRKNVRTRKMVDLFSSRRGYKPSGARSFWLYLKSRAEKKRGLDKKLQVTWKWHEASLLSRNIFRSILVKELRELKFIKLLENLVKRSVIEHDTIKKKIIQILTIVK